MKIIHFIMMITFISCFCLSNCADANQRSDLLNRTWVLNTMEGEAVIPGSGITLFLESDNFSGNAGCNSYGGDLDFDGQKLELSEIYRTSMACSDPEGVLEQESQYLNLLEDKITHYQIQGGQLILLNVDDPLLVYDYRPPTPDADLEHNNWELSTFIYEGLAHSTLRDTQISVVLDNGEISGETDCHVFTASYSLENNEISITQLEIHPKDCVDSDLEEQSNRFLDMLKRTQYYEIEGNHLRLIINEEEYLDFIVQ